MKSVYVVLAFHAHEPLWDFPGQLQALADREEIRQGVASENYLRKRQAEGRDIYLNLLAMGQRMQAPLCLEASNELLFQIQEITPETFKRLREGFQSGALHPILGHAHHTHISLLHEAEIVEELRLNAEYFTKIMQLELPEVIGAFPTEDSIDYHKLEAYQKAGVRYLIFPHLDPAKCRYRLLDQEKKPWSDRIAAFTHQPFSIGHQLLALPRNFPISQYIWKPITQMRPEPLRAQGYLLGDYPVFAEEYQGAERVPFPITMEEAVAEYTAVLREEVEKAPDKGLLLYIQDLELMDFGETALELMEAAWGRIQQEGKWEIIFTTPEDYLKGQDYLRRSMQKNVGQHTRACIEDLPVLEFDQISWAPEIRPVLRVDGHYPPLGSGEVNGVDVTGDYLRDWPLAFWETGRYFVLLTNYLLDQAGFDLTLSNSAEDLVQQEYHPEHFSVEERLRLLGRLMKRACNWGWRPDEARQKRPLGALYIICQELAGKSEFQPRGEVTLTQEEWKAICSGLQEINRIFLTYRQEYLRVGLQNLGWLTTEQKKTLDRVIQLKEAADQVVEELAHIFAQGYSAPNTPGEETTTRLVMLLKEYCRHLFLGTDLLQQIWGKAPEAEKLVTEMYLHLYKQVPPRFLRYLKTYYGQNRPAERVGIKPARTREEELAPV